ncbi:MAG: peptidyl-prolyl cis-trans isomerase [Lachnoclostridium sp.]|jgi:foldase protein PrsA|nr:peptidyl-prolyl cis-trans isomerase [Lachnoclostridium sp.]
MKRKICIIISVLLLLCTAGCSSSGESSPADIVTGGKEQAGSVANGDLAADSVIITVGNTDVTYREYQMYSYLLQSKYDTVLDSKIWDYRVQEDQTLGTEAVREIVRMIIQLKIIEKEAIKQNISLTVDEKEEITFNIGKFLVQVPETDKNKYHITEEMFQTVLENNVLARMMFDVVTGSVNTDITPEQERVSRVQMIYFMSNGTNKENKEIKLDAAGKTALFDKANRVRARALKGSNFYTLAEKNTSISGIDFDMGPEDEPGEVTKTALAMKAGTISEVISTDDGFYLLRCISNNDKAAVEAHREELILSRQTKAFQDKYKEWTENYEVRVSESILERELYE